MLNKIVEKLGLSKEKWQRIYCPHCKEVHRIDLNKHPGKTYICGNKVLIIRNGYYLDSH